jgi:hypothetical protein
MSITAVSGSLVDVPASPAPSPRLDRRVPPEWALLLALLRFQAAPPSRRAEWARVILDQTDPPLDEDRPALRAWLGVQLGAVRVPRESMIIEEDGDAAEGAPILSTRERERMEEADHLHRLSMRLDGQPRRQRRLLEQELLLRSPLPEDWAFHRAKWRYLQSQEEQAGSLLAPHEAARRARQAGVWFHPDQLVPGPLRHWPALHRAVDMLEPGTWLRLLDHVKAGRPVDLGLPPGLWVHVRPWLRLLAAGRGLPCPEVMAGSLPEAPPQPGPLSGLLVVHSDGPLEGRVLDWVRQAAEAGWRLCVVRPPGGGSPSFLQGIQAGAHATEWVRRNLFPRQPGEGLLSLREFVRLAERQYILDVLGLHKGVKSRACERLQISRQTLYSKLGGGGEDRP